MRTRVLGGLTVVMVAVIFDQDDPTGLRAGPWCPRNISDGPERSGIWLDKGEDYDADGAFVRNLSTFYQDDRRQLFDPATGAVNVTDSKEAWAATARPHVDPAYKTATVSNA